MAASQCASGGGRGGHEGGWSRVQLCPLALVWRMSEKGEKQIPGARLGALVAESRSGWDVEMGRSGGLVGHSGVRRARAWGLASRGDGGVGRVRQAPPRVGQPVDTGPCSVGPGGAGWGRAESQVWEQSRKIDPAPSDSLVSSQALCPCRPLCPCPALKTTTLFPPSAPSTQAAGKPLSLPHLPPTHPGGSLH